MKFLSGTFITMIINFLIVLFILARFMYKPLRKVLEERSERIGADLKEAEASRQKSEAMMESAKNALKEAQQEANRILERAKSEADQLHTEILAKARREAEELLQRQQSELERAQRAAREELRAGTVSLALLAMEKIIGGKMTPEINESLVDQTLEAIAKGGTGNVLPGN